MVNVKFHEFFESIKKNIFLIIIDFNMFDIFTNFFIIEISQLNIYLLFK